MAGVTDIVNQVLTILRQQTDSEGKTQLQGTIPVSPASFLSADGEPLKHNVLGPITFETSYDSPPAMSFVQYGDVIDSDVRIAPSASNYTPFLVQPYVYSWSWSEGVVDGFFIGMYALTNPKETPRAHQITWQATGIASRYLSPNITEAWTLQDSSAEPDYLIQDATDDTYETY